LHAKAIALRDSLDLPQHGVKRFRAVPAALRERETAACGLAGPVEFGSKVHMCFGRNSRARQRVSRNTA